MITIQLKQNKESSPISLCCGDYDDMLNLTYIFDNSKNVLVYNVSLHGQNLLENSYNRKKWIDKSFYEYFGDDE